MFDDWLDMTQCTHVVHGNRVVWVQRYGAAAKIAQVAALQQRDAELGLHGLRRDDRIIADGAKTDDFKAEHAEVVENFGTGLKIVDQQRLHGTGKSAGVVAELDLRDK